MTFVTIKSYYRYAAFKKKKRVVETVQQDADNRHLSLLLRNTNKWSTRNQKQTRPTKINYTKKGWRFKEFIRNSLENQKIVYVDDHDVLPNTQHQNLLFKLHSFTTRHEAHKQKLKLLTSQAVHNSQEVL